LTEKKNDFKKGKGIKKKYSTKEKEFLSEKKEKDFLKNLKFHYGY